MYKIYCWSDRFKKMWAYSNSFSDFDDVILFLKYVYKPTHYYLNENNFIYKVVDVDNKCFCYFLVVPLKKRFNIVHNIIPSELELYREGIYD